MTYWKSVFNRALRDAREALGHNLGKTLIAFLLVAIAAVGYAYLEGGIEGWKKVEWWLLTAAAELLILGLIFAWQFMAAPAKMHAEALTAAKRLAEEESLATERMKTTIAELEDRIGKMQAAAEYEKAAYEAQLAAARNSDPRKNIIRHEISLYLQKLEKFLAELKGGKQKYPLDLARIEQDIKNYIRDHFPEYTRFVGKHPIKDSASANEVLQPHHGIPQCEYRIERLKELLQMLG